VARDFRISAMTGCTLPAARSASALIAATASARAALILGFPSLTHFALAAASADVVRPAINALLFGERGMKVQREGIDVRPSSETTKRKWRAIRPEIKCATRETRSSLATERATRHPRLGERRR
jgi:hypothetical protein